MKAQERIEEIQAELAQIGPKWLAARRAYDILNVDFQALHGELHRLQRENFAGAALPPYKAKTKKKKISTPRRRNSEADKKMLDNLEKSGFSEAVKDKMAAQLGLTRKKA